MNGDVVLDVEISRQDGSYVVVARSSAGDEGRTVSSLHPDDPDVQRRLERLRIALLRSAAATRRTPGTSEQPVIELGSRLFDAVLSGDTRQVYEGARRQARLGGGVARVILRVRPPELAVLPWEFMYDVRRDEYLAQQTPLFRQPDLLDAVRVLRVDPPLRVLGMVASPSGFDALDVNAEKAYLEEALGSLVSAGSVELEWVAGQTWRDLQRALAVRPRHILHFIGHGGYDEGLGEGVFALPHESGGTYLLRAGALGTLLTTHQSMRLVILNSCDSATGSETDPFSSAASTLVRRGTPAVLAMQFPISDHAALEFTRSFYLASAGGLPVDVSLQQARVAMALARPGSAEWGTPVLFLRQPDGRIFDVAAPPARPRTKPASPPPTIREVAPPAASPRSTMPAGAPALPPARSRRNRPVGTLVVVVAAAAGLVLTGAAGLRWSTGPDWAQAVSVDVPAARGWTDTGVQVTAGETVRVRASGQVSIAAGSESGPDGAADRSPDLVVLPDAAPGALVGRVGDGPAFLLGADGGFRADRAGEVQLGVNDLTLDDDTGWFSAQVLRD